MIIDLPTKRKALSRRQTFITVLPTRWRQKFTRHRYGTKLRHCHPMYRQVYQTKREAYRAYAVGPTRRSLRLNCEVYLRFYFQKEVEIMKTSDAANLFFVVASSAASLSRILHTATNTGNGCGCGRSFTAKLRPFEEQVSSLIGQLTCRGIGTGRVLDMNIYIHPFNGPFFRNYPGEPVPER